MLDENGLLSLKKLYVPHDCAKLTLVGAET